MHLLAEDSPKQNRILAALGATEYDRLVDDLELVSLKRGQIIYESGDAPDYAFFPTTCIVSRVFTTENGASVELAMTGNEGLVGTSLILGSDSTVFRIDVQSPGNAYRLKAEIVPPPARFYYLLGGMVLVYLLVVELAKRGFYRWSAARVGRPGNVTATH